MDNGHFELLQWSSNGSSSKGVSVLVTCNTEVGLICVGLIGSLLYSNIGVSVVHKGFSRHSDITATKTDKVPSLLELKF